MTGHECITRLDRLKPNSYAPADKLFWLRQLEETVKREIIDTHELPDTPPAEDTEDGVLIAPPPFDEMYIHYLEAQIDYANGEFDRFNNSNAMFRSVYSAFANAYNREHMARSQKKNYM